jgi:hypothetical protein
MPNASSSNRSPRASRRVLFFAVVGVIVEEQPDAACRVCEQSPCTCIVLPASALPADAVTELKAA